ncbi:MAG: DMT family transporter [Pseudomonadota bacterium]|nr:DMT family transporter [Pseudomonadota bacterium]
MQAYTINWILLMILSAVWGGAFTLNKQALNSFTPELIVMGRLVIGSIILTTLIYLLYKKIKFRFNQIEYFLVMSIVGIVAPFLLIAYGQKNIDSSLAGVLMSVMPISTLALAHLFLNNERMTKRKILGFILAFLGVIILLIPGGNILEGNIADEIFSELMVVLGAILYSAAAVYGKKFKNTDPLNASAGTILFSAIIMLVYLLLFERGDIELIGTFTSIPIILLGVFCTALATILYFQILQTSGATFLSIMNYLIPIWAIIFGVIFFQEKIFWNYLAGLLVITFGIQISKRDIYLK